MTLAGYVWRDLVRNPRRTIASMVGVIVGVGLFSAVLFFIDGSGASMTKRAIAPLALDAQRVLTAPLGGGIQLERKVGAGSLNPGQTTLTTLTVTNNGVAPAHEVVIRDRPSDQLNYVLGSTTVDGSAVLDVNGSVPLWQEPAGTGLNIGTVGPGTTHTITYRVDAVHNIRSTGSIPVQATVSTREAITPNRANAPRPASLVELARAVARIPGVKAADPLVFVNMAAGSISAHGTSVPGPVKLFAFDAKYQAHYPSIKLLHGRIDPGGVVISAEAARSLKVAVGDTVTLHLPGGAPALALVVSGISDLSQAKPLFYSRGAGTLEKFLYVPYTVVVDHSVYVRQVAPAFEHAAAGRYTGIKSLPLEELDILLDRSLLHSDPGTALGQTQTMSFRVLAVAPGQDYLIDNISNTLKVATGDAAVAKRMFVFLGLPGAILAALLTAYAGSLLGQAQRRENALLRVRGANQRHLLFLLALRTIAVAGIGSLLGATLGFASVFILLGRSVLFEASTVGLLQSALISVGGGMLVTGVALYVPGRRLIRRDINQDLATGPGNDNPGWKRLYLFLAALIAAGTAQIVAGAMGTFNVPAGSVYAGQSVSLPVHLLAAPIVGWLAATYLLANVLQKVTSRAGTRNATRFGRVLGGLLWRSITRRLGALTGGVITVALVVGLGTTLSCFATTYDKAKIGDARFLVGSDIRLTPNPTSKFRHPIGLATDLRVGGASGATAVVYSPENAVLTSATNEDVATLAAVDPLAYRTIAALQDSGFVHGSAHQMLSMMQQEPDGILVNKVLADGLKVKAGDRVRVMLGRGTDRQIRKSMKVLGLFTQFPGAPTGTDLVANRNFYERSTGLTNADYYLISTTNRSQSGLGRVTHSLSALPDFSRRFDVQTSATALDKDQSSLTALNVLGLLHLNFLYTFAMAATAMAMFVFGLLLQRRREYVTLRAQGLQGRAIRRLVLIEASISAIVGSAIGILVGVGVASQFIRVLRPIFTLPPILNVPAFQLSVLGALVITATVLSSVAAAVLIARLKPTELLREE